MFNTHTNLPIDSLVLLREPVYGGDNDGCAEDDAAGDEESDELLSPIRSRGSRGSERGRRGVDLVRRDVTRMATWRH